MDELKSVEAALKKVRTYHNPGRSLMIQEAVCRHEAEIAKSGCLSVMTPGESTGRSPLDTVIVRRRESEGEIDWDSPNNLAIDPETFDMMLSDCAKIIAGKDLMFVTDRVVGADPAIAMPVRTITSHATIALFTNNMFRPRPEDLERSVFRNEGFTLIDLPYDKLNPSRYEGRLRVDKETGRTSSMVIAMDLDRRIGIVYGSAYCGSAKKLIFTAMNHYLPSKGILPLHCSANEGPSGDIALFLGLSGTGKTTLSAVADRSLLGDDEHAWSDNGICNFENGCYAKLINLDPDKEPEIYRACFHESYYLNHGAIIENAKLLPDGNFDLDDDSWTKNSRGSYPLTFLANIKPSSMGNHPRTIIFLTADANGVLSPISKLNDIQAMLWFLMGYTSKLAGTEVGIDDPQSTFSRFFGEPFMPRLPNVYAEMLGKKMNRYESDVFLINTGWSGGPFGQGARMDINLTRSVVEAALSGELKDVPYDYDPRFHLFVPRECPGVPTEILQPKNTWKDQRRFDERANRLAHEFSEKFDRAYGNKGIEPAVRAVCPGK